MNDLMDRLNENFKENKGYYIAVLLLFCIGIVIGACTVKYMNTIDKQDMINYFTSFVDGVEGSEINYTELLLDCIKKNLMLILPILVIGLTFVGAPVILIVDFIKGFTLSYTFSFLLTTFDGKGLGIALVSVIPQNIVYIPSLIILSVIALKISTSKFKERVIKKTKGQGFLNKRIIINNFMLIFIFFIVGIMIETYVEPSLIRFVLTKVYA